jgi:transmembrane sensor
MENKAWHLFSKKLSGELNESEARELNDLLSSQPDLHMRLQSLESIWDQWQPSNEAPADFDKLIAKMNAQGISFEDSGGVESAENTTAPIVKMRNWKFWSAVASAAAVITIALFFWSGKGNEITAASVAANANQVTTRPGSKTKIELPDGTQVWLNADSKLTYGHDYGATNREVTLSGEAFFDVVSDKAHPFYIHTSRIKIKVTGTAFNVRSYPNESKAVTSLVRGKVEVTLNSHPDKTYYLHPSEKITVSDNDIDMVHASISPYNKELRTPATLVEPTISKMVFDKIDSIPVETAWVNNRLPFDDESFREVADKMERWYGVKIVFASKKLELERLNGKFENEPIDLALHYLQYTVRFNFVFDNNTVIISERTK